MYDDAYLMGKLTAARQAELEARSARAQRTAVLSLNHISRFGVRLATLSVWLQSGRPRAVAGRPVVGGV